MCLGAQVEASIKNAAQLTPSSVVSVLKQVLISLIQVHLLKYVCEFFFLALFQIIRD